MPQIPTSCHKTLPENPTSCHKTLPENPRGGTLDDYLFTRITTTTQATLPTLGALAFDPSQRVRASLIDLLQAARCVRDLRFWEVVPLDALLQLMGSDAAVVTSKIQALLLPSYFPSLEEGPAFVVALLRQHPLAGAAFCRLLADDDAQRGTRYTLWLRYLYIYLDTLQ